MRSNARSSLSEAAVSMKSSNGFEEPLVAGRSKNAATGTSRTSAMTCRRPAPMRLVPFSYF